MKKISKISLFAAGILLLLHTFIPHEHHSELDENTHIQQHKTADGLYDYLQLAFHIDLGSGHLDHFNTSVSQSIIFAKTEVVLLIVDRPIESEVMLVNDPIKVITDRLQIRFRGPPSLS